MPKQGKYLCSKSTLLEFFCLKNNTDEVNYRGCFGGDLRIGRAVLGRYRRLAWELFVSVESVVEVLGGAGREIETQLESSARGGRSPRSWKRGNSSVNRME